MGWSPSDAPFEHVLGVLRLLVIAGGPLPLCAALLAADPTPRSAPQRLLVALTLWCLIQADVALLAGALGRFDVPSVVAAELMLLLIGAAMIAPRRQRWREMLADAAVAARRTTAAQFMVIAALLLAGITQLWFVAAVPVIDWDSWAFHMPSMARWLQEGAFVRLEQYAYGARGAYPHTWQAVCALFAMPFGEDAFATLPNLVVWTLLGVATYVCARDLSASRTQALAAGAFVLSGQHLLGQVNSMHVDVPFAAFVMVGLSCVLGATLHNRRSDLAVLVAALGLLCAVRTSGPMYVLPLLVLLFALGGWSVLFGTADRVRVPRALTVICVLSAVLVGSFWWVKNVIDYRSPLGPVALTKAGVSGAAPGRPITHSVQGAFAFRFDALNLAEWTSLASRLWTEIGLSLPIMLAQLLLLPAALRADRRGGRRGALLAALLLGAAVVLFVFTPTSGASGIQTRLGFAAVAMLAVAGAVASTGAGVPGVVSAVFAIAAIVETSVHSRVFQIAGAALVPVAALHRWRPSRKASAALVAALAGALLVVTLAARERRVQRRADIYGPAFAYLEEHVGDDEPIGYFFSHRSYYFYGGRLRRPVRFVPMPKQGPTPKWFARLRDEGFRAVAIGPEIPSTKRDAVRRLEIPDGQLKPVFGRGSPGEITIYRFADP